MVKLRLPVMLLLLAVALLLGRGLLDRVTTPRPTASTAAADQPDYTMTTLHTRRYGADGKLARDLAAEELVHYPDARGSLLTRPLLTSLAAEGEPWLIRADEGRSPPGEQEVFLRGHVHIDRAAGPGNEELHLATTALRVVPEQNYADTGEPVAITSLGMRSTGVGLNAWLDKEQLQLMNDVRGQYETKPQRATARP